MTTRSSASPVFSSECGGKGSDQSTSPMRGWALAARVSNTPAIRVATEQIEGATDVRGDGVRVDQERGRQYVFRLGNAVALVPAIFSQHGLLMNIM